MERVNSAASVVTAILESTGYYTQAEILERFSTFFMSGGAILYFLALAGATASFGIFGSFRMGRYLLVGPGLLFFLVFTRTDIRPVVWRLGGDPEKSIEKYLETGPLKGYYFSKEETVEVSWFFAWYTHLISEITRGMSDVILKDEYLQYLLFLTREQGYKLVIDSKINDKDTTSIVADALLGVCAPSTSTLIALSDDRFSVQMLNNAINSMDSMGVGGSLDGISYSLSLISERMELLARLKVEKDAIVNPGEAMRRFIRDITLRHDLGPSPSQFYSYRDYKELASPPFEGDDEAFVQMVDEGRLLLSCQNAWIIAMDAIKLQALQREREIYDIVFTHWKVPNLEDFVVGGLHPTTANELDVESTVLVCETIIKKLYGGNLNALLNNPDALNDLDQLLSDGCSLAFPITLYMLRNQLSQEAIGSDAATRSAGMGYSSVLAPWLRTYDNGMPEGMPWAGPGTWAQQGPANLAMPESLPSSPTGTDSSLCPPGSTCANSVNISANRKATIASQRDESFNEQLDYLARSMMKQIFNYSLQIPYWQGVILYLLAIAYPFFAVVVVLPNRATAFFYIPMAWLWVKSWDVGFALVRVFDQIIWELLPGRSLSYADIGDKAWEAGDAFMCNLDPDFYIPTVLRKILRDHPAAQLYQHYFFVSMALFAVPAITGILILKGRSITLASFTDAARSYAARTASEEMRSGGGSSSSATGNISSGQGDFMDRAIDRSSGADESSYLSEPPKSNPPADSRGRNPLWTYTPPNPTDQEEKPSKENKQHRASPTLFGSEPNSPFDDLTKKPNADSRREGIFPGLIDKFKQKAAEKEAKDYSVLYGGEDKNQEPPQPETPTTDSKKASGRALTKTGFNDKE